MEIRLLGAGDEAALESVANGVFDHDVIPERAVIIWSQARNRYRVGA
jgi:hypothetical protein